MGNPNGTGGMGGVGGEGGFFLLMYKIKINSFKSKCLTRIKKTFCMNLKHIIENIFSCNVGIYTSN